MTTTSRLPVSQSEAPRLSAYLTGALGTAALLGASQADAAVTSVTFGFGPTLETGETGDFAVGSFGNLGTQHASGYVSLGRNGVGDVYHDNSYSGQNAGRMSFFNNGYVIGSGGNSPLRLGEGYLDAVTAFLLIHSDVSDKNIGFRTSTGNYGWANVSWNSTSEVLTVHSAYVESVVGAPITVGATSSIPEPAASAALLALAGLGVAATRRRPRPLAA